MTDTSSSRLHKAARYYAESLGWVLLPCHGIEDGKCTCRGPHTDPKDIGKHPALNAWNTDSSNDVNKIDSWWRTNPVYNIGVVCNLSGLVVIDVDPRHGGLASLDKLEELLGETLPKTVEAITGAYTMGGKVLRGKHIYFKCSPNEKLVGNLKANDLPGIDIKHNGYVLMNPSNHLSGVTYEWAPGCAPWEIEVTEIPDFLLKVLRKSGGSSSSRSTSTSLGTSDWGWLDGLEYNGQKLDVEKMLTEGIDEGSRAVDLYAMTCALANKFPADTEAGRMAIETMMIRFNAEKVRPPLELEGTGGLLSHVRRAINFVVDNPKHQAMWPGLEQYERGLAWAQGHAQGLTSSPNPVAPTSFAPTTGVYRGVASPVDTRDPDDIEYVDSNLPGTIGGAVNNLAHTGATTASVAHLGNINAPGDVDAIYEGEGGRPGQRSLSDLGNGRRLVDNFGSIVRYTPGLGWFVWNGGYWKPDMEELEVKEISKKLSTSIASEVVQYDDPDDKTSVVKWANQAKSNARMSSAIESATSDPRVGVATASWDSYPQLIGVQNGVIDLKTGELLRGQPDLYITRRAPVAYTPGLTNERWDKFVDEATNGDKELQSWLQMAAGYTLTGYSTQDVLFLVYGPPGSGKNTFVEAIVKCLGTSQYAWPLDSSILAQGDGQSSSTDLYHWAELRGRRMVWVDELPESERIKENAIKKLTGSSEISARSPGEKPFTFQSQAKLWLTTNHRPIITDDAMWRRLRPIPWTNRPAVSDPSLKEFLFDPEGGLPAVLAWAVEGAMRYLNSKEIDPLGMCTAIYEASDMYRRSEDRIGMFLNEETKEVSGGAIPVKSIYSVYRWWSEERGEKALSQIAFVRKMRDRGIEIVGDGSRAELMGRVILPKAQNNGSDGAMNWDALRRFDM